MKPRMVFRPTDGPLPDQQARWEVVEPVTPPVAYTIPYTELPEAPSDDPQAIEWNTYRQHVASLLAEGHEGKWVLVLGDKILGVWDSEEAAEESADEYPADQPVLIMQVLAREPVYFIREAPRWAS